MQEGTKGVGAGTVVMAALAGVVAGALLVSLAGSRAAEPSGDSAALASPDVARELKSLTAELVELRAAMGSEHLAATTGTPSAPGPLRADPSEAAALQALADAVSRLSSRLAGSGAAIDVPASASSADQASQQQHLDKLLDQDSDARSRQHLLWPMQRVLDTYGQPDRVQPMDNDEFWYWGSTGPRRLCIRFHDGHVVSIGTF